MKRSTRTIGGIPAAKYRRMLEEKRQSILSGFGVKFYASPRMDRIPEEDQAQVSHDEFVTLQLNSLDYMQLRLIDEALDRLRSGDYGLCLACDTPIPQTRLQALPWARHCVECQERLAKEEASGEAEFRPPVLHPKT
jgi:DnaK suppressor protein